jgi:hypothetical protein
MEAPPVRLRSFSRRWHRRLALVLLAPLVAWALTGLVFLVKPGYAGAYAALEVRALPFGAVPAVAIDPSWTEARLVRTVLGEHLLVRTASGRAHLDPRTGAARAEPLDEMRRLLVEDAIACDPSRYGRVARVDDGVVVTDTGVRVELDWTTLRLSQRGRDTDWIDALYHAHYLQWTGVTAVDRTLGVAGPVLLVLLAILGVLLLRGNPDAQPSKPAPPGTSSGV